MRKLLLSLFTLISICSFAQVNDSLSFFGDRIISPYYYQAQPIRNEHDFYTIKKIVTRGIDSLNLESDFSGIITITFFINYEGKTGYFTTKVVNPNYAEIPTPWPPDLVRLCDGILQITRYRLGSWSPAKDDKGLTVNTRKFYSFRFNHGSLQEIFPK